MSPRLPPVTLRAPLLLQDLFIIVPALLLIFYTATEQRHQADAEAQETVPRVAQLASTSQKQMITATHQLLISLARAPEVTGHDSAACSDLFTRLMQKFPPYANLGAIDPDGNVFCSAVRTPRPINVADRAFFRRAVLARDFVFGDYEINRATGEAAVDVAYPVLDHRGDLGAVVFAALDLTRMNQILNLARLPERAVLNVFDQRSTMLLHYPDPAVGIGTSLPQTAYVEKILASQTGVIEAGGLDGVRRLFGFTPLLRARDGGDIYLSIGVPQTPVFDKTARTLARNLALFTLAILMALTTAWVGADLFILRRLQALGTAANRLRMGELRERAPIPGDREMSELAHTFNLMADAVEERTAQLEKSNKVKVELLSILTHELRSPLSAIIGYAGIVKDRIFGDINTQQERALGKILSYSNDLLGMIDSILEVTRSEAGEFTMGSTDFSPRDLFEELRAGYDIPLNKEVAIVWDYRTDVKVIRTDRRKLKHIAQNLINNAIKFTDRGRITVSVRYPRETGAMEIKVADTGIGIPKDKISVIFEMFRQIDSHGAYPRGGVGLGLYIVKKFTDILGGRVEVESEPGKGSTFTVTIPASS